MQNASSKHWKRQTIELIREPVWYLLVTISISILGIVFYHFIYKDIGTIVSVGVSVFLAFVSLKLTTSVRNLKNLLLINTYSKEQASYKGRKFLITQVFLNPKKHFLLNTYIDLKTFLSLLDISEKKRKHILEEAEKNRVHSEFGADYANMLINKRR